MKTKNRSSLAAASIEFLREWNDQNLSDVHVFDNPQIATRLKNRRVKSLTS
ncbi:hypothetical protein [Mangrovibacterium lignilyticum]|uniref:hypothetical protein n=1 Tax=Mangrovibacterium lignilyticum TaxID=2668052 RepID=UPI0013D72D2F|nr:hypothetical protein [Mangrovibacterium lignilyticum]